MSDQFKTYSLQTSEATPAATSLRELQAGNSRSTSQDGRQMSMFGADPAHASPSQQQGSGLDGTMTGISGISGSSLSEFAARQLSLANKLKQRLDWDGSIEYSMTWRRKDTRHGRVYYQLAASARRTSGPGCFGAPKGWSTPTVTDRHGHGWKYSSKQRRNGWSWIKFRRRDGIPRIAWTQSPLKAEKERLELDQVQAAGWNTPNCMDSITPNRDLTQMDAKGHWGKDMNTGKLSEQAQTAGWATPNTMDHLPSGNLDERKKKGGCVNLKDQVPGAIPPGSPAQTGSGGGLVLNARFVAWLMGVPMAWMDCAPSGPSRKKNRDESGS